MKNDRLKLIFSIVDDAIDLNPDDREAYVRRRCKMDAGLQNEVTTLLNSINDSEHFWDDWMQRKDNDFDEMVSRFTSTITGTGNRHPSNAGPWKIIRPVGRGGMATVYLAQRSDGTFDRNVALKLLDFGFDQDDSIHRFSQEQKILARLDHPGIARLYDAGLGESDHPWIAMEYVDGMPVTKWCSEHCSNLNDRLHLFLQICEAVRYAHRNLVVHRDLKPDNILVTILHHSDAANPVVKVLDFGIAKFLDEKIPVSDLYHTRPGLRPLSLAWAAPEQITGNPVTASTDVYALGMLLYEMLAGRHPFDLKGKNLREIEKMICNDDPDRPGNLPGPWQRDIRGDLDAIIMKCLRKEPEDRYESAGQLLDDIRNHLDNKPVIARKQTTRYRLNKYMKRHYRGILAAAIAIMSFTGLAAHYTLQLAEQRDMARTEAMKAMQITGFIRQLFDSANPDVTPGESMTVIELLDIGRSRFEALDDEPLVKAEILSLYGDIYRKLGHFDDALDMFIQSAAIYISLPGNHDADLSPLYRQLGLIRIELGNYAEADSLLQRAYRLATTIPEGDRDDLAKAMHDLAFIQQGTGRFDSALDLYKKSLHIRDSTPDGLDMASATLNNMGWLQMARGNLDAADTLLTKALEIRRRLFGDENSRTASSYEALASLQLNRWNLTEAETAARKSLEIRLKLYEPDHPEISSSYLILGNILRHRGLYDLAEQEYLKSLTIERKQRGENNLPYARLLNDLAAVYQESGDYRHADSLYRESFRLYGSLMPDGHPFTAMVGSNLAYNMQLTGDLIESETLYRKAYTDIMTAYPEKNFRTALLMFNMAGVLADLEKFDEARELLLGAQTLMDDHFGPGHWRSALNRAMLLTLFRLTNSLLPDDLDHQSIQIPLPDVRSGYHHHRQALNRIIRLQEKLGEDGNPDFYRGLLSVRSG